MKNRFFLVYWVTHYFDLEEIGICKIITSTLGFQHSFDLLIHLYSYSFDSEWS